MNQLALFDALPVPAVRTTRPEPKREHVAGGGRPDWAVSMLARLPITSSIQGERWRQYTVGLYGRIEWIEGDVAGVRIESTGHKFDGKLAAAYLFGLSGNN